MKRKGRTISLSRLMRTSILSLSRLAFMVALDSLIGWGHSITGELIALDLFCKEGGDLTDITQCGIEGEGDLCARSASCTPSIGTEDRGARGCCSPDHSIAGGEGMVARFRSWKFPVRRLLTDNPRMMAKRSE